MLSVLMLCSFSVPPIAATASRASVRAVGVDEHAVKAKAARITPVSRFHVNIVPFPFVDDCAREIIKEMRTVALARRSFVDRRIQRTNVGCNRDHVVIRHLRNGLLHQWSVTAISSTVFELVQLAHNVNGMEARYPWNVA